MAAERIRIAATVAVRQPVVDEEQAAVKKKSYPMPRAAVCTMALVSLLAGTPPALASDPGLPRQIVVKLVSGADLAPCAGGIRCAPVAMYKLHQKTPGSRRA